jgi:hypothetical protein
VFASPDGSHAFFQSTDRLTEAAPEDSALKTYDFDVDTGTSEYLSEINGSIATVSSDGLSLLFENTATSPFQLERWVAGPHGGTATPIAELPAVAHGSCGPVLCIGPAYVSSDGKVATFATESPIAGFNDGGTHYQRENPDFGERPESGTTPWPNVEAFRYDAQADELSCVSCPPSGMVPASNAVLSIQSVSEANNSGPDVTSGGLAMSADGSSVFFETRDALLPGDVNGTSDVYEWRAGRVYAISSGRSSQRSFFVGMSESGGDVFFATTEGIVPGDTDDGYDVYDARIPRPGDAPPPEAIPCEGAVCQGPPSVPNLLGQPASEAFNGAGNPVSAVPPPRQATPKSLTRAQKLARALNACKHRKDIRKRKRCERQARHKYGAHVAGSHSAAKQARHHNGRGK